MKPCPTVDYAIAAVKSLHAEIDAQREQDIRALLNWPENKHFQASPEACAVGACILYGYLKANEVRL